VPNVDVDTRGERLPDIEFIRVGVWAMVEFWRGRAGFEEVVAKKLWAGVVEI
jgi:hypothetical protein